MPRLWAAEKFPNVPDQKTFLLKENDLEKGWYVIFVQNIFPYKKSQLEVKKANEFSDGRFLEFDFKKANLATLHKTWTYNENVLFVTFHTMLQASGFRPAAEVTHLEH